MQKIILDTNVIVSALIQRSFPYLIVSNLVIEKSVILCISETLFKEYLEVLNRPKFSKYPDFIKSAEYVLSYIESNAEKFSPNKKLNVLRDKDDNMLIC